MILTLKCKGEKCLKEQCILNILRYFDWQKMNHVICYNNFTLEICKEIFRYQSFGLMQALANNSFFMAACCSGTTVVTINKMNEHKQTVLADNRAHMSLLVLIVLISQATYTYSNKRPLFSHHSYRRKNIHICMLTNFSVYLYYQMSYRSQNCKQHFKTIGWNLK